jgi:hypothetical protein
MTTAGHSAAQLLDLGRRGQEAAVAATRAATRAVRAYADALAPQGARPVDPQRATAATFELAERLLRVQRDYATSTVALLGEAGGAVAAQASATGGAAADRTRQASEQAARQAAERVADAAEATRDAATAARNGAAL